MKPENVLSGRLDEFRKEPSFCTIRELEVEDAFHTYCANWNRKPSEMEPPVAGVDVYNSTTGRRDLWVPSPDTEEIRQHLLSLLTGIVETGEEEHATYDSLLLATRQRAAIWQLGEFREVRATEELTRISRIEPGATFERVPDMAQGALAKIAETTGSDVDADVRGLLELAHRHLSSKNYAEAIESFSQVVAAAPGDPSHWYYYGLALGGAEDIAGALDAFQRSAEINPQSGLAWHIVGHSLVLLKRYEEALQAFGRAIDLEPEFASPVLETGMTLMILERNEDAIAPLERATELDKASPQAWRALANAYKRMGRDEDAEHAFSMANLLS